MGEDRQDQIGSGEKISFAEVQEAKRYLYDAMTIGEKLLISGAEVSRVEDTISRICRAYGAERVDVFSITSSIVVTIHGAAFGTVTQTRRVLGMQYDMHRLEMLNQLSREICAHVLKTPELERRLQEIEGEKEYPFPIQVFAYGLISAAFSVLFGGSLLDAVASAFIGFLLKPAQRELKRMQINTLLSSFVCSVAGGLLAVLLVRLGLGQSVDKINIGNIMLLIPGVAMTNGIRDMFNGDMVSGLIRFFEALLIAVSLALGFVFITSRM